MKKLPEDSEFFLSPTPSREMILMLAKARARRELAEEAKQAQQNPRIAPNERGYDAFAAARERLEAADAAADQIMKQMEIELAAISKHFALRRRHIQQMKRAREILGDRKFFAARAEARRRREEK